MALAAFAGCINTRHSLELEITSKSILSFPLVWQRSLEYRSPRWTSRKGCQSSLGEHNTFSRWGNLEKILLSRIWNSQVFNHLKSLEPSKGCPSLSSVCRLRWRAPRGGQTRSCTSPEPSPSLGAALLHRKVTWRLSKTRPGSPVMTFHF